jgi:hypothetical protein
LGAVPDPGGVRSAALEYGGRSRCKRFRDHAFGARATETVVTNDLDFGTLLALTGDVGPSVVLLRAETLDPEAIGAHLCRCLARFGPELNVGALLVLDEVAGKVRLLPIPRT